MAEIRWTREAERWLKDIYDYIAIHNPKVAGEVVESIYRKVQILKRLPEIGHRYECYLGGNIRILLHGHYRVVYLVKENRNIIVLGVFHGALDIDRYLKE